MAVSHECRGEDLRSLICRGSRRSAPALRTRRRYVPTTLSLTCPAGLAHSRRRDRNSTLSVLIAWPQHCGKVRAMYEPRNAKAILEIEPCAVRRLMLTPWIPNAPFRQGTWRGAARSVCGRDLTRLRKPGDEHVDDRHAATRGGEQGVGCPAPTIPVSSRMAHRRATRLQRIEMRAKTSPRRHSRQPSTCRLQSKDHP